MAAGRASTGEVARLWGYTASYRWIFLAAVVAVVLRSVGEPLLLVLLKPVLKLLETQQAEYRDLLIALGQLVMLTGAIAVADFAQVYLVDYVAQRLIHDLRRDLFNNVQRLSLSYFEDASTGRIMSRATNNINTIQTLLNFQLAEVVRFPIMSLALVVYMLSLSLPLTIICAVILAGLVPVIGLASRLTKQHTLALQDKLAELSGRMQESIAGIRVVQCFGATDFEIKRFAVENAEARRAMMRIVRVRAILTPVLRLLGLLGLGAVLCGGGYLLFVTRTLEYNELFLVASSLFLISSRSKIFGRAKLNAAEVLAAAEQVFEVIDTRSAIVDPPQPVELGPLSGRVTFERVSFAYATGGPVLTDIDLELRPGEVVAVVGPSGSGKSTLANLIPRLYDPTAGQVLVDGHDLRAVSLASLRSQLGIVPQQTLLFSGSIRDNIAYGNPAASQEQVLAAAEAANAARFIADLPAGYDTAVGERGAKLSGGQAQRIAIARAILRDPRILILDEATSALDTESEHLVQEALERLMHGRTSLVIAHRLSTISRADRIVFLEGGRVVEQGTHAELLAAGGRYLRAVRLQGGEAHEP